MHNKRLPHTRRSSRSKIRKRRAISEIVATLIMIAIVAGLGVLTFTFASSGLGSLSQNFTNLMGSSGNAISEKYVVEQVAFTTSAGLALDGSTIARVAGVSVSVALTTTLAPDVIYVVVTTDTGTINTPTAAGLTFTLRAGPITTTGVTISTYYAIATSPLAAVSITETTTGGANLLLAAFGVSGANTASPFDPNASVPASATGTGTVGSFTISTSNANDFIIGTFSSDAGAVHTAAAPWTLIVSQRQGAALDSSSEYQVVSATQTNLAVTMTLTGAANWAGIADAIKAFPQGADVYVRNVGTNPTTLVSVYVVDQTLNSFVSQTAISTTVNVGTFANIPHTTLLFTPLHGHTYSFTVTSSLGNSVIYNAKAT